MWPLHDWIPVPKATHCPPAIQPVAWEMAYLDVESCAYNGPGLHSLALCPSRAGWRCGCEAACGECVGLV